VRATGSWIQLKIGQQRTSPRRMKTLEMKPGRIMSRTVDEGQAKPSYIYPVREPSQERQRVSHIDPLHALPQFRSAQILEDLRQGIRKQMHDWTI
jgi:hypothetical protein